MSQGHPESDGSRQGVGEPTWIPPPTVQLPLPSAGGRYRIVRFHRRGGLGEIYVALDEELQREVALKFIQGEWAFDPEAHARFLLEAEITGRLEHPGVVPVYGLVRDGRGCHAMRFIQGQSLEEAVRSSHGAAPSPAGSPLPLSKLLRRFVAVCETIAYAHSRGILHRDLKPANVMLGPYGETLVVDWGLARSLPAANGAVGTADPPLRPVARRVAVSAADAGRQRLAGLHESRAGRGPPRSHRRQRRLQLGGHPLRRADRPAAVHRRRRR